MTKPLSPEKRKTGFWLHVCKTEGCWFWEGAHVRGGYGLVTYNGKKQMAHRVAWMLANGEIPKGKILCHRCDNPPCVRPDHLFLGTHKDNSRDMLMKGREASGDKNGSRTMPHRRAWGDRNGTRTCPESRERGDAHWTRRLPERVLRGAQNGNARLSDVQVTKIRELYAKGLTQQKIAERFGVTQVHVSRLVRGAQRKGLL